MAAHARFSFSAAHRWMACPGSIQACAEIPDTTSWQAERGARLHEAAAAALGGTAHDLQGEEAEIVGDYVKYVQDLAAAPTARLLVEQRVTLSRDVWGTCDAIVIQPYVMHIIDFKTGSQRVNAERNAQLLGYAAAALNEFNVLPSPIHHPVRPVDVVLHIVQTSIGWVDTWTVPVAEIAGFVKRVEAAVRNACSPAPDYRPSEEACQWCPARATCRALAEFNVDLAITEFALADPPTLSMADIERILPQVPLIVAWATSIQAYATSRALQGETPRGYKLVQSGGARRWINATEAIAALVGAGVPPEIAQRVTPIGIGDAERLLGKRHAIFAEQCARGEVKPVLAPAEDKRKEWGGAEDFPD